MQLKRACSLPPFEEHWTTELPSQRWVSDSHTSSTHLLPSQWRAAVHWASVLHAMLSQRLPPPAAGTHSWLSVQLKSLQALSTHTGGVPSWQRCPIPQLIVPQRGP